MAHGAKYSHLPVDMCVLYGISYTVLVKNETILNHFIAVCMKKPRNRNVDIAVHYIIEDKDVLVKGRRWITSLI